MHQLIPINVVIADRTYRLKILPHDEEVLRGTVKSINEKIVEYKSQLAGKDMQDYVSMVLLWFTTSQLNTTKTLLNQKNTSSDLEQIENMIEKMLE